MPVKEHELPLPIASSQSVILTLQNLLFSLRSVV